MKQNINRRSIFYFPAFITLTFLSALMIGCRDTPPAANSPLTNATSANQTPAVKATPMINNSPIIGKYRGIDILPDTVGEYHNLGDDSKHTGNRWADTGKENEFYRLADRIFVASYGRKKEEEVFIDVVKYSDKTKATMDYYVSITTNKDRGRTFLSKKPLVSGVEYAELDSGLKYVYVLLDDVIIAFSSVDRKNLDPFIEALKTSKIVQDVSSQKTAK